MIPTIQLGRLYRYKEIYNKIYIVRLDNKKIIWIQDVHFYKEDIPDEKDKGKALFKAVFDKEAKEFILGKVRLGTMFGSSKPPTL